MKELRFSGSSDDTFGWDPRGDDYDNCASGDHIVWRVSSGDDSLLVWGQYAAHNLGAGWMVGVSNDDDSDYEAKPIKWPVRVYQDAGGADYTPTLLIEAPDDATVTLAYPKAADQ